MDQPQELPQDLLFQDVPVLYQDRQGWVRFSTEPRFLAHPELPVILCGTLTRWFRENSQFHLRCVLPFNKGGNTVELHAWYDLHAFPPPAANKGMAGN